MRIIALRTRRRRVGKTTTTSTSARPSPKRQGVCLIDLDPQAHLTINYASILPRHDSLYDVLVDGARVPRGRPQAMRTSPSFPVRIDLAARRSSSSP